MPSTTYNAQELWQKAFNSLPEPVRETLDQTNDQKLDKVHAALKVAEDKRQLSLKKRWRKRGPGDGEDIIVRDIMEKIVQWIRRFRDIGDTMVQYDPGHAALPWAAVRFLLQSAINDMDVHTAMVEDLEMVTKLMARYDQVERRYLPQCAGIDDQLSNAILSVYAAVLEFLGKAVKYFKESAANRFFKAPFRSVNESSRDQILARDAEVFKLASLADAGRLINIEAQVLRMADLSLVAQKQVEEKLYVDVLRWLSTVEYPRHHADHSTARTPGTCQWLLQHPEFLSWESGSTCSLLLLYGIPGCGKTTLSSAVIDRYREAALKVPNSVPVAYFYCCDSRSEEERHTTCGLLRSLARQLIVFHSQGPSIHSAALSLYERLTGEAKTQGFPAKNPSTAECIDLILAVVDDNPATIIIDAVDELDQPKGVMDALQTIMQKASNVVKVFATARESAAMMTTVPAQHMIRVTAETNKTDVRLVATDAVGKAVSNCKLLTGKVEQPLKDKLIDALASSAGEMFLLIKFQLLRLSEFEHEEDVLAGMANLGDSTLDTLYKEAYAIILKAGDRAREIAIRTFSWLLYAREELTLDALLAATAIKQTGIDRILAICRGFVYFDSQSKVVRFVHHSVQEFLCLQQALQTDQAQELLAMSCICACKDPPGEDVTELRPSDRFYDYAALYYGHHCYGAQSARQHDPLLDELEDFLFGSESSYSPVKLWLDYVKAAYDSLPNVHPQKTAMELVSAEACAPLFIICTFGLYNVLKRHRWPLDFDWDQQNDYGHTALYAACFYGHTNVVGFLIDRGASVNIECGRLGSALHCAAFRGKLDIVHLLLDRGVDRKVGKVFRSTIHAACRGNREEVALAILDKDAILSCAEFDSILEAVLEAGFSRATEKLYNLPGSNAPIPNTVSPKAAKTSFSEGTHAATQAIIGGQLGILKRLLRKSSAADILPNGSVALAALNGKEEITRSLLLDQKLDVEETGELGTPLRCAALNGHSNVCRLLFDLGADINGNSRLGSALHAAAMKGHLQTVRLLIHLGADVNIHGGYYGTPLQAATCLGHAETVRLLLSANASPRKSGLSKDAFHAAAENGQYHIIQILLSAGFEPPVPMSWGKIRASRRSRFQARNLLRESSPSVKEQKRVLSRYGRVSAWRKMYNVRGRPDDSDEDEKPADLIHDQSGADPKPYRPLRRAPSDANFNPPDGNYPLEAAADLGHLGTVSMMLENHMFFGLNSSAVEKALSAACRSGHQQIVKTILEWREEIHVNLSEALSETSSCGHVNIVETLLKDRSSVSNKKRYFKVALKSAIRRQGRFYEIIQESKHEHPPPEATFHEILNLANGELSELDITDLLLACSSEALQADRADVVKLILAQSPDMRYKRLLMAFCQALESAKARTVAVIYDALQRRGFSPSRSQSRRIILLSAGNGLSDLTSQLLRHYENRFDYDSQLLQQVLNIAAHNGHHEVCTYLLSRGVDPCLPAYITLWREVSSSGRKYHRTDAFEGSQAEDDQVELDLGGVFEDDDSPQEQQEGQASASSGTSSAKKCVTALTSSLSGYQRFHLGDRALRYGEASWQEADEQTQVATVRLLLDHIPSMKGIQWAKDICCVATSCPLDILQLLIGKDADPSAHVEKVSVLQWAARRERLSFVVSRMLIEAGADKNMTEDDLRHLLGEALKHFRVPSRSREEGREDIAFFLSNEDDSELLSETESLEDAFSTGPGALVHYLLRRIPEFRLEADSGGILLQCAAAAGHDELVETLIGHGAEANWTGSYYGTALQAASRFGHVRTTRILLDIGSDPNVSGGKHGTALRAAVVARSFQVVTLLLESGSYERGQGAELSIALQHALSHKDTDIALALVAAGANVQIEHQSGQPAFIQACATGHLPLIKALLKIDVNVNVYGVKSAMAQQETGSPVHAAIHIQRPDLVKMLLANGFELKADFGEFEHPLTFATRKGELVILDILLDSMSDCSLKVLWEAIEMGITMSNLGAIKKLTHYNKAVFNSDTDTDFGFGLLQRACGEQSVQITQMLLEWLSQCGVVHADTIRNALKEACAKKKKNAPITELLLEWLSERGAVDTACAAILCDVPSTSPEIYEILLEYTPCTTDIFIEACIRDYPTVTKIGLGQGMGSESEDNKGRSALVLACAYGSASVVKLLLDHHGNPNSLHPIYGTPLRASMEGCAACRLLSLANGESLPEDVTKHAQLLVEKKTQPDIPHPFRHTFQDLPNYQKVRQFESVVQMLLSRGAEADTSAGHFGTALSLAAYMGLRNTFDSLLQHGASVDTSGGFLQSPLVAAILGNHSKMAKYILSLGPGGMSRGLCCACKKGNLSVVKALLDSGVPSTATAADGQTALQLALAKVASLGPRDLSGAISDEEDILNLLLDTNTTSQISDQELVAATQIEDDRIRERVLNIMIARAASPFFPEEGLIRLLYHDRYGEHSAIQKLMQHRKIQEIPIRVMLAAKNMISIKKLVAYDPRYNVTPAALDATMTENAYRHIFSIEKVVELLLRENGTINVSESDVLAALRLNNSYSTEEDRPHIVKTMFDRNERLRTTEEMLKAVRTPRDLDVLLAHTSPEEGLVTPAVMSLAESRVRKTKERHFLLEDKDMVVVFDVLPIEWFVKLEMKLNATCATARTDKTTGSPREKRLTKNEFSVKIIDLLQPSRLRPRPSGIRLTRGSPNPPDRALFPLPLLP
ncbi:hypothetical protein AOR_1_288124 [Paecilomyces variotii No. 5]|uniref:Ankyrin repeat-containing domain protein n=1 Tax=Byssochlamys spectabilis (strain No. 5 / NBRC 109023) TaxID=1356009 RepID=V5I5Y7_BYSSN|nr:hypothetical protein AOR_1_288124 [Paecilomyces variotii No. 5]